MGSPDLSRNGLINFRFKKSTFIEDEVTVDRLNALIESINSNAITNVVNGYLRGSASGKTLVCSAQSGPAAARKPKPWDMYTSTTSGTTNLNLYPGKLNEQIPSNMFTPLTCSASGFFYVTLDVTTNGKSVTNSVISIGGTSPTPPAVVLEAGPNNFKIVLGVIKDGVATKIADDANLIASLTEVLRVSKADPQPFALPYDSWYTFTVRTTGM